MSNIEAIDLIFDEDPRPHSVYLRGHFDDGDDAALDAAGEYLDEKAWDVEGYSRPPLRIGRRVWARWGFAPADADYERAFHVQPCAGRGAFAVTEVWDVDERERRRAAAEAKAAHAAELEARVMRTYPEATEVRGHGYPLGDGHVDFGLPGLQWRVRWRACDPGHVRVRQSDVEAFEATYQGRGEL